MYSTYSSHIIGNSWVSEFILETQEYSEQTGVRLSDILIEDYLKHWNDDLHEMKIYIKMSLWQCHKAYLKKKS